MDGNLCRCTGYRPIIDALRTCVPRAPRTCHKAQEGGTCCGKCLKVRDIEEPVLNLASEPFDFPERFKTPCDGVPTFSGNGGAWHAPQHLADLLTLLAEHPDAKMICGGSEVEVEARLKRSKFSRLIFTGDVAELKGYRETEDGVEIGAALSLSDLADSLHESISRLPAYKTRSLAALESQLERFASRQVRNAACVGGNISTASPTGDLAPVFVACNAEITVASKDGGERKVFAQDWFKGYRKTDLQRGEAVVRVKVLFTKENEFVKAFKQTKRLEDDISIISACLRVVLDKQDGKRDNAAAEHGTAGAHERITWKELNSICMKDAAEKQPSSEAFRGELPTDDECFSTLGARFVISDASLAFGSVAAMTILAKESDALLRGKELSCALLPDLAQALAHDFALCEQSVGGNPQYRRTMGLAFCFKFFVEVLTECGFVCKPETASLLKTYQHKEPSVSSVDFEEKEPAAGRCEVGDSKGLVTARGHVTGESQYTDDVVLPRMLHAAIIPSPYARCRIVAKDFAKVKARKGVVGVFDIDDVTGNGCFSPAGPGDEWVYAKDEAPAMGFPLGIVVARTHEEAVDAATWAARNAYTLEQLEPVVTIRDAIEKKSFLNPKPFVIGRGDVEEGFAKSDRIIEGEVLIGGQEHFYLETQSCVVEPSENDTYQVFCSSQNPSKTQGLVSQVLGVQSNQVTVTVRRVGGGFGGKEARNVFVCLACAVPAKILKRPVKLALDRDIDMTITGTRHPFYARYKVGYMNTGKLMSGDFTLYSNGGYSNDLSFAVLQRGLFHLDNAYNIPYMRCTGYACKTNTASNTAFRGFGGPQGMLVIEDVIERIGMELGMPQADIRELNFYKEGEPTHFLMPTTNNNLQKTWDECKKSGDYERVKADVAKFNSENRFKKRGMSIIPLKFGISFTQSFLNQAGALVHVYSDGSVLVSHGGVELGQGLHTKMAMIAADVFQIPLEKVRVGDTSTDKVPNTSPTAASSASDLNGMAVLRACTTIKERLDKYKEEHKPESDTWTWEQLVGKAYFSMIDLSAHGFYKTDVWFDFEHNVGKPFAYFTYGAALAEVEIDLLTGDHLFLLADVVMDIGRSLNPALDIGQLEGAFVQGAGWATMEELLRLKNGAPLTTGPGRYKVPGITDIPRDFRVHILKGARNPMAVKASKGLGEPPLFLGAAVYFAIKDAVYAARRDAGIEGFFNMRFPATCEVIKMSCRDGFTDLAQQNEQTMNGELQEGWIVQEYPIVDRLVKKDTQ